MTPLLLSLALLLGSEQIVTAPSYGPLSMNNYGPAVAASSTNFLAAWLIRPPQSPRLPGTIALMPFTEAGAEARTQILLGSASAVPGVGSNGDDYLVAWTVDGEITARRVAKNGTPLGAAETLAPSRSQGQIPLGGTTRVLWDGAHYVVVAAANVYINNVVESSVELAVAGSGQFMTIANGELLRDAAEIPGVTLAVSMKGSTLYGRFIDAGGNVSAPFAIANGVSLAAAGSDGTSFFVAWVNDLYELRVARAGLGGTVSPPLFVATGVTSPPAFAWNGRELGLAWSTAGATEYAVIPPGGVPQAQSVAPHADAVALAGANGVSAVVAARGPVVARVIRDGSVSAFDLSSITLAQYAPRAAGDALFYLEGDGGTTRRLVRQTGDARAIVAENAVAYDADDGAVAWVDGDGHGAVKIGQVVDSFAADGNAIAIASNGSTHLIAFRRGDAVWAARVDANGALSGEVQLSNGSGFPTNLHAVWRGDDFLVEWQEDRAVKSALAEQQREALDFLLPPGAIVHNLAASNAKTAIAWSVDSELHLGSVDPEGPSPGAIVAREPIRSAAVFATPAGFDLEWIAPADDVPAGDIAWASPHLILYSKGIVIAQRAVSRPRRRVAPLTPASRD